jgi:hypothetical protein
MDNNALRAKRRGALAKARKAKMTVFQRYQLMDWVNKNSAVVTTQTDEESSIQASKALAFRVSPWTFGLYRGYVGVAARPKVDRRRLAQKSGQSRNVSNAQLEALTAQVSAAVAQVQHHEDQLQRAATEIKALDGKLNLIGTAIEHLFNSLDPGHSLLASLRAKLHR